MEIYLGEIRMFACEKPPKGWLPCDGREMKVKENQALFSLIRETYGGDGKIIFNLPDMRGMTPVHMPKDVQFGKTGGAASVTLGLTELPAHTHSFQVTSAAGTAPLPTGNLLASKSSASAAPAVLHQIYSDKSAKRVTLDAVTLVAAGDGVAHNNMQPYVAINYFIAVEGASYPAFEN